MKKMRLWMVTVAVALGATLVTVGAQQAPPAQNAAQAGDQNAQGLRQWSKTLIDVDFQATNLRSVLRTLAEIGGINLVVDPSVPPVAPVDLKLTQVPWDQVMDVVLRSAGLTYEVD